MVSQDDVGRGHRQQLDSSSNLVDLLVGHPGIAGTEVNLPLREQVDAATAAHREVGDADFWVPCMVIRKPFLIQRRGESRAGTLNPDAVVRSFRAGAGAGARGNCQGEGHEQQTDGSARHDLYSSSKEKRRQEPWIPGQTISRNSRRNPAASSIATGSVRTQAKAMLLIVDICRPDLLAAIVPATPEEST